MQKLYLQKTMTFEEVKHFFSKCGEYEITQHDNVGTIKITLVVTTFVNYDDEMIPEYEYEKISILSYRPTVQTLIRDISNLGYLKKDLIKKHS